MAKLLDISFIGFMLSAAGGIILSGAASAETTTATEATRLEVACLQIPAKLSDADVQAFMSNPPALLSENPAGGASLSDRVRALAGSSSRALQKIMEVARKADDPQKSAIAAGLARVVFACDATGGDMALNYGLMIQTSVATFGDPAFASTFQTASKDVSAASIDGPAAAGFSVGGGATAGTDSKESGDNKYRSPGDGPLDTSSADYTVGDANAFGDAADVVSPTGR